MVSELVVAHLFFAGAGAGLCLMLTVLFFASSASCGIAVLLLVLSISSGGRRFYSLVGRFARLDVACIVSAGIQPALIAAGVM